MVLPVNPPNPPLGVSAVALLVWLNGVWGLYQTGRLLWTFWDATAVEASGGYPAFIAAIAIGFTVNLVIISLAGSLRRGSGLARVVVTIFIVLHVILGILVLLVSDEPGVIIGAWIATVLNILALGGLWIAGRAYFARQEVLA